MKKRLLLFLLLGALASVPSVLAAPGTVRSGQVPSAREAALPYVLDVHPAFPGGEKALELWDKGRLEQAIKLLEKPDTRDPVADAHRRLLLGVLLLELDAPVEDGGLSANGRRIRPDAATGNASRPPSPGSSPPSPEQQARADRAAKALSGLEATLPLIADHVIALRGRALLQAGRPDEALEVLRSMPDSSPLRDRTLRLMARSELERDMPAQALLELNKLTGDRPLEALAAETLLLKGRVLERLGTTDALPEALRHYRALTVLRPLSLEAQEAKQALNRLTAGGLEVLPPTPEEQLAAATAYLTANLNEGAATWLEPLFKQKALEPAFRCEVAYGLGTALQNQRKYTDATAPLTEAAEICDVDRKVKSLYRLGRGHIRKGNPRQAEPILLDLASRFPDHSYADDALFLLGVSYQDKGELDRGSELLEQQIERFPNGDMRGEAAWRLAWIAYRKGDLDGAIGRVEGVLAAAQQVTAAPASAENPGVTPTTSEVEAADVARTSDAASSDDETQAPRLTREAYWRARWLELGSPAQKAAAQKAYLTLTRWAPLDYYGVLAYRRLEAIAPELAAQLVAEDVTRMTSTVSRVAIDIDAHPPGIARAVSLLRSGLKARAVGELVPLVGQEDGDDDLLIAYLLEQAGRFDLSHGIPRRWLEGAAAAQVGSQNRLQFFLAFPPAFQGEIDAAAEAERIDPLLLRALAREESAFDAEVRSWAGAIGLVQLMEPTAQRMAKQLKKKVTAEDLIDPGLNARLGAHYLAALLKMFSRHPGLAVPAYNAGEGAVARWIKERGTLPFDEFVEEIPYKQTRDYVKRVLSSYQTYQYLYRTGKPFLELPMTVK